MEYGKIDPELVRVLDDYKAFGRTGLKKHMRTLGIVSTDEGQKPPRISVFLRCEEDANFSDLSKENIKVNQMKGKIRTAFLPLEKISQFSEDSRVKNLVSSRYLRLRMDVATKKVNLSQFKSNSGLDGNGIVIGVVDTGIDPIHPAFSKRIMRIWDQTISGPGVEEGNYGIELDKNLLTVSRDTNGHGTHVAGIAVGSDGVYGGIAPRADLIIVKTDFTDTHISDGVRYVFRVAEELKRPVVVNLSLGGHDDPHDGTDPFSEIINEESGPGKIVCCAAGNEGNDNIHAQTNLKTGETKTIRFWVPLPADGDVVSYTYLNGWYSGDDEISISLISPNGFTTQFQDIISSGSPMRGYSLPDGLVRIQTPTKNPSNGDHQFSVEIIPPPGQSHFKPGTWKLRLKGKSVSNGRVDIWSLDNGERLDVIFSGSSVSDTMKIGSPGSAREAITVASYTTKVKWQDITNTKREIGMALNDISDFSSEGPLRNGKEKPDITAPGAWIAAPLSADSQVSPAFVVSSQYRVMQGTSMATPFVAGIVALLLQRKPDLTPNEVKELLKANSSIPGKPPKTFDLKWGYGNIDAGKL